jgi:hypothetical protein
MLVAFGTNRPMHTVFVCDGVYFFVLGNSPHDEFPSER